MGVVLNLEGVVKRAKVLQCGECAGYQTFMNIYSQVLHLGWCLNGSTVQMYTMRLVNFSVSEVILVSGVITLPRNQEVLLMGGCFLLKVRYTDRPHQQHHLGAY